MLGQWAQERSGEEGFVAGNSVKTPFPPYSPQSVLGEVGPQPLVLMWTLGVHRRSQPQTTTSPKSAHTTFQSHFPISPVISTPDLPSSFARGSYPAAPGADVTRLTPATPLQSSLRPQLSTPAHCSCHPVPMNPSGSKALPPRNGPDLERSLTTSSKFHLSPLPEDSTIKVSAAGQQKLKY